jgi:AcrR family transcriptional regulator
MFMRKTEARRLTRDDWAQGALAAIARGGIAAVAVETVAAELGATKGSFYWHFKNRDALIEAALERWERRRTEDVIEEMEHEPDPAKRLRKITELGFELRGTETFRAEIALLSNPGHPAALRAVRRVAKRRLEWFRDQLEALGWSPTDAHDRAVLFCHLYVGNMQLAHLSPRITTPAERRRQLDLMFDLLVAGERRTSVT